MWYVNGLSVLLLLKIICFPMAYRSLWTNGLPVVKEGNYRVIQKSPYIAKMVTFLTNWQYIHNPCITCLPFLWKHKWIPLSPTWFLLVGALEGHDVLGIDMKHESPKRTHLKCNYILNSRCVNTSSPWVEEMYLHFFQRNGSHVEHVSWIKWQFSPMWRL